MEIETRKGRKMSRTKNPKKMEDVKKFLSHAAAHCRWGSNQDNTIRDAEPADLDAAKILEELREDHDIDKNRRIKWKENRILL
jgi:hypothetical protein